jgi:hypothetical protein
MTHPDSKPDRRGPWQSLLFAAVLTVLVAPLPAQDPLPDPQAEPGPPPPVAGPADTREILDKWVEVRKAISGEKRDWTLGREALAGRRDVVARELSDLSRKLEEADRSLGESARKREELATRRAAQVETLAGLESAIGGLEESLRRLLQRCPAPAQERVRLLSARLPVSGGPAKGSLSERFQTVIGILNELQKFHREITVRTEERRLHLGSTLEVTAVYLGLAQGWYVSADGTAAGIGGPGDSEWTWTAMPEAAEAVRKVVAILKSEAPAAFVRLPATLH